MQLTILGNGAGGPFQGRHYTAQILQANQHTFLIDCGEGTQQQLFRYRARYDGLGHIFISHLHGDHVFGLMGLLTSFCLKKRTDPLELFSPPGLEEMIETTSRVCGIRYPFELIFHVVDAEQHTKVYENPMMEIWTIPLLHRIACTGWLFKEKQQLPNMRRDKIVEYDVEWHKVLGIKEGGDLTLPDGRVIAHEELTTPARPPRSYAFCSDTAFSQTVVEAVKDVTLLYHEATFLDLHAEEAAISYHSTARQAAETARLAGAKRLLMGHFSGRYKDETGHLMEARDIFRESYAAEEGGVYQVQ